MSRPPAAAQPNATVAARPNLPMNAATPTPAPFAFAGPFQSPGVPRPEPYPAPFYQTWRPLVFPPVLPPGAFRGPRVYQPPPPPPGGFRPHPGTPFNPFGLPGFRPSHTYPPVSVLSHQRPAVIDGTFSPGAMTRPPIAPVPPANVFGPGAVTRPQPLVPPANFFGPGAVTRPPIAPVPPSNAFGPGAVARPPIAPLPPSNAFGPGAVARPPITHIPPANVFGPGALTRPPIAPVPPVNVFGPGAMARPSITHVPPANVFGFGAVTRPPIAPIPRANVFGPGAVTRPPITPVPQANVFGPGAVTRPPITPVRPATDFGPGAVTRSAIAPVPPANEPEFKVYVGKIASTVDNYFVLSLLQVCGLVKSWNPVTNPIDGTSTGFGFCDFESAEGCLRARRLLNKLSIDGQELLLNVNEATREYVQKYGQNTTEEKANEADKDAMQMIHSMVEERMRSKLPGSRITPIQVSASIGDEKGNGDTRSDALEQRKIMRQRENEERLRESKVVCLQGWKDREVTSPGKSSLQIDAIRSMYVPMERECTVEHERKRQHRESECTSSMYVPIGRESTVERERKRQHRESECISSMYVPMEREYTVEHERNRQHRESECISSRYVPMERESTVEHEGKRQHRESECISSRYVPMERESTVEHEGKRQHRESECFSSRYVPMERESTVEHEGKRQHRESECISSRYVPMERESTVEHERKCQHRERDGFHKSNGEGKGIVSVSGLVLDKLSSSAPGERVGFELQATCKPGNKETLDEEQLLAAVPKTKEELFAYDVNWAIYDKHGLHERMRPWVSEKSTEVFGEEIAEFVEYVVASTKEHVDAPRMLETLVSLMDDSAENFVLSFWTQLIFEIKKVETGLA